MAQRTADRPARLARERELQAPILHELAEIGVHINWIHDFDPSQSKLEIWNKIERHSPPVTAEVAAILLKWLPRLNDIDLDDLTQRNIIAALRFARGPYDGRPLVDLYNGPQGRWGGFRQPISELFSRTQPTGISDWLVDLISNRGYDIECGFLLIALARQVPPERSVPLLRRELEYAPSMAAAALGEVGRQAEAELLESYLKQPHEWESKDLERWTCRRIERAIRLIRKRCQLQTKTAAKPPHKRATKRRK